MYGGWRHDDGRWITAEHRPLIAFHEAAKALFCPLCHAHLGQIGTDPLQLFGCDACELELPAMGKVLQPDGEWLELFTYATLMAAGGKRSSKTTGCASEFAAWLKGYRDWDGSLTAPPGSGRDWGIFAGSYTQHFKLVIMPYFEQRMAGMIEDRIFNAAGSLSMWIIRSSGGGVDRVHCLSYEQYNKAGKFEGAVNPFDVATWYGVWWDEIMPPGARIAVRRGLTTCRAAGWGRELIGATLVHAPYLFNTVYEQAWNRGGSRKEVFVIHFSIHDNPSQTEQSIEEYMNDLPVDERETYRTGRPLHLLGRVYSEFDENVHVFDHEAWDPLMTREAQKPGNTINAEDVPSDWPVYMAVDPHDRRPWFMIWIAVDPIGRYWVVNEWPHEPFEKFKRCDYGFDEYASVIEAEESAMPGGVNRVMDREMDPAFGRSAKAGTNGQSIQEAMQDRGLYFRADVKRDMHVRHTLIHNLLHYDMERAEREHGLTELNRPHLYVSNRCRNVIWGFFNYIRNDQAFGGMTDKNPTDKVKEVGKDPMDALGYCLMRHPQFFSWKERNSWMSQQRSKIIRGRRVSR